MKQFLNLLYQNVEGRQQQCELAVAQSLHQQIRIRRSPGRTD